MSSPLRIGVIGAGHLGRIHLRCLQSLSDRWDTVGFYDPDEAAAQAVMTLAKEEHWAATPSAFPSAEALLDAVDAVAIVTPTPLHALVAEPALAQGVHCFIEKPVTNYLAEAEALIAARDSAQCVVQVGHVERFNPCLRGSPRPLGCAPFH